MDNNNIPNLSDIVVPEIVVTTAEPGVDATVIPSTGAGESVREENLPVVTVPATSAGSPPLTHNQLVKAGIDLATENRIKEIAAWAEKKRIFNGTEPPTTKQLNKIYNKLKKGLPIVKAVKRVCSVPTWNKWKREFPEVAAMEEHAMAEAVDRMLDKKEELAARQGTKMGEIARDKLQIDELDKRIDRIDRLTENRNSKSSAFGGSVVPIQINFGFGKK